MEIDWSRPEGQRIRSITVGGAPLDPARTYTVAMNSYLPGCEEYPLFATLPAVQDFGTCEQALRSFVGSEGWEGRIYELSGTVSYVEGEEPSDPETPETPSKPSTRPSGEKVPATGDPTSVLGLAALLGTGATSLAVGARLRRRSGERVR